MNSKSQERKRFPYWLRKKIRTSSPLTKVRDLVYELGLHTVCESARCPNIWECFSAHQATFLILGNRCTRGCRFCAVTKGSPTQPDPDEPHRIAEAVQRLGLRFVVITSVTRDDLPDGGSSQFASVIHQIRATSPRTKIEVLIPDFNGKKAALVSVIEAQPDVLGHNIETIPRLYSHIRPEARYTVSMDILKSAKGFTPSMVTKSGLMVGLGERYDEVLAVLDDLHDAGVDIVNIGQYLQSHRDNTEVREFVPLETFEAYERFAYARGFRFVASGPFVRSSYHSEEAFCCTVDPNLAKPEPTITQITCL